MRSDETVTATSTGAPAAFDHLRFGVDADGHAPIGAGPVLSSQYRV